METRDYNGVEITESWDLMEFAEKFGTPKIAKCVNKNTGEMFKSLAFDKNGEITWCHFGYSTQGMSAKEIVRERESLKVGLTTSDKYTLYKQNEDAWEELRW